MGFDVATGIVEIRDAAQRALSRHPFVLAAVLFGSQARGEASPKSDVDLYCVFDLESAPGIREYGNLVADLQNELGRSVDIVTQHSRAMKKDWFREEILRDGVVVYERKSE